MIDYIIIPVWTRLASERFERDESVSTSIATIGNRDRNSPRGEWKKVEDLGDVGWKQDEIGNSGGKEPEQKVASRFIYLHLRSRPNLATYLRIWRNGVQIMRVASSLPLVPRVFSSAGIF